MRDVIAWGRERLFTFRILLLWLVVLAAAAAAGLRWSPAASGIVAAVLVAQFRLWDDLADLPHDRRAAPARVLLRAANVAPFTWLVGATVVVVAGGLAAVGAMERAVGYLLLVVGTAALYASTDPLGRRRSARNALVLVKYPAFVLLIAADVSALQAVLAAGAVYAVLMLHDWRGTGSARVEP